MFFRNPIISNNSIRFQFVFKIVATQLSTANIFCKQENKLNFHFSFFHFQKPTEKAIMNSFFSTSGQEYSFLNHLGPSSSGQLFQPKSSPASSMNGYVQVFQSSSLPFATKSIEFKGFVHHLEQANSPDELVSVSKHLFTFN